MKKYFLFAFIINSLFCFSQVNYVRFKPYKGNTPTYYDLKDVTVHVIIKDFCDDAKQYKKILEKYWKHSKLSFDYTEKHKNFYYTTEGTKTANLQIGEWYMYLYTSSNTNQDEIATFHNDNIIVGRYSGKNDNSEEAVIWFSVTGDNHFFNGCPNCYKDSMQALDITSAYINFSNENYFINSLRTLDEFVEKKITDKKGYQKVQDCESADKILNSILYIPKDILHVPINHHDKKGAGYVDFAKYFKGYLSKYKILTPQEMTEKFNSGESFYYLSCERDCILESTTGKIMNVNDVFTRPWIAENNMTYLYEYLNKIKGKCKK